MWWNGLLLLLGITTTLTEAHIPHDVISSIVAGGPDGETVFALSRGQLLKSEDGGYQWQRQMKGMSCIENSCGTPEELSLHISPAYDQDETVIFGSKKYGLQISNDGGNNWRLLGDEQFHACLGKGHVSMAADDEGGEGSTLLVAGDEGKFLEGKGTLLHSYQVFQSVDSGKSFTKMKFPAVEALQGCPVLYSASASVHFVATPSGPILATNDGGTTWTVIEGKEDVSKERLLKIVGAGKDVQHWHLGSQIYKLYLLRAESLERVSITYSKGTWRFAYQQPIHPQLMPGMTFSNVLANPSQHSSFLMLMQTGCAYNKACDRTLFLSSDSGETWSEPQAEQLEDTQDNNDGHAFSTYASQEHYEEFNDAYGVAGTDIVYLASYEGVFKSIDNGRHWHHLDTLSGWITGLSVGSAVRQTTADGNLWYFVNFCTYANGCFGGRFQMTRQTHGLVHGLNEITKHHHKTSRPETYSEEMVVVSPNHAADGIVIRSTYRDLNAQRMQLSYNNFKDNNVWVSLPPLDPSGDFTVVHSIVFSPTFVQDQTVFASGHNIGLARSINGGLKFETLWQPETKATVTEIALSPFFGSDGIMALLVDETAPLHEENFVYKAFVYVSYDAGKTFTKTNQDAKQWMNIVFVKDHFTNKPQLMSVHQGGSLHVYVGIGVTNSDDYRTTQWTTVEGSYFPKFWDGFAVNGVVASPNGDQLMAAFQDGGTVSFNKYNATAHRFMEPVMSASGMFNDSAVSQDEKFGYQGMRKNYWRGVGDAISFSPYYEEDSTIFAASFYSIYASFDQGVHWWEIFRLPHNNTIPEEPNPADQLEDLFQKLGDWWTNVKDSFVNNQSQIIGSIVVILFVLASGYWCYRRRQQQRELNDDNNDNTDKASSSFLSKFPLGIPPTHREDYRHKNLMMGGSNRNLDETEFSQDSWSADYWVHGNGSSRGQLNIMQEEDQLGIKPSDPQPSSQQQQVRQPQQILPAAAAKTKKKEEDTSNLTEAERQMYAERKESRLRRRHGRKNNKEQSGSSDDHQSGSDSMGASTSSLGDIDEYYSNSERSSPTGGEKDVYRGGEKDVV